MPYESHSAGRIGEMLILSDGTRRVLSHLYFVHAKLISNETLLKLYYSFCRVDITGERLSMIFDDIAAGRLGVLSQNPDNAEESENEPVITSIIYLPNEENKAGYGR